MTFWGVVVNRKNKQEVAETLDIAQMMRTRQPLCAAPEHDAQPSKLRTHFISNFQTQRAPPNKLRAQTPKIKTQNEQINSQLDKENDKT
eukprot:4087518-Amphidinium_carterae.1